MSYLKDDYADEDWDDHNEDKNYDDEAQDASDYEDLSEDEAKAARTHDDEKAENSDQEKPKHEEDEDLESIEEINQHLMIIDLIPDVKKEELDLNDDEEGQASPNTHTITSPYISKYEKAMVIGKRAQQIGKNSPIYAPLSQDEVKRLNALQIAELEFETGRIPMIIRRYLPDKTFEDWKIKDLKKQTW